jgi:hypothetical protein
LTTAGARPARRAGFLAALVLLVGLGLAAQLRSYAGPDMGFLLDEAARALNGARLYVDLVDMNPPLIVVLNMRAVLAAHALGIPEILAYRLGCAAAMLGVLLLSGWLLRRLLAGEVGVSRAILLLLTFALFVLPGQDFGEREHLLAGLLIPYLLLTATRAAGCPIPPGIAALVGRLAASAFALKPQFVVLWIAVEACLRVSRRVRPARLLPETVALAGFLLLYAVAILLWAPGYIRLARLLAGPYARFLYVPFWELLIRGPGALLTVFALLASVSLQRYARHRELLGVLTLGALACLVAGAAQQKGFSYHFYPSIALSTMVLGVAVLGSHDSVRNWVSSVYRVIALSVVATVVLGAGVKAAVSIVRPPRDLEQRNMERLVPVVRARAGGETVYVMSYNISSAYPLINYAGARSASRFAQLWILASAYMDQLKGSHPLRYHTPSEMSPSERFLNQAVLEDLQEQRPKLLIVLQHARDLPINGFRRLDYVAYFSRDPRIHRIFEKYQFVTELEGYLVYERMKVGAPRTGPPPTVRAGTRDVVQGPRVGSVPARIRDPAFQFSLLTFVIIAIFAALAERARAPVRVAPGSA